MSDLPTALITEILSRLPVKSLLRFRTVAKSWKSLIDTSYFINLHLNNALLNPNHHHHHSLILKTRFSLTDPTLYSVDFPSLNHATRIDCPFDSYCGSASSKIVGSCNGLLCVSGHDRLKTFLFNPATRKYFRVIPVLEINDYARVCCVFIYGFGYDYVNDDYKLVCFVQPASENDPFIVTELRVFSLKANCWSKVSGFPAEYFIMYGSEEGILDYDICNGVYVNGCLHWVVYRKPVSNGYKMIVAFDLAAEEHRVVSWPEFCGESANCEVRLGLLEGCLMVQFIKRNFWAEVWIMKEYNVKESWTKLFSIPERDSLGSLAALKYIAYSKRDGVEEVLIENESGKLVCVNVQGGRARGRTKRVKTQGIPSASFEAVLFVESLVSFEDHEEEEVT